MKYCLLACVVFVVTHFWICECALNDPTPKLMKTAYCACMCCKKENEECYKHSSIKDGYKCKKNKCDEKFCKRWNEAKCKTSCYCSKCKSLLPPDNQKCALYDGVDPGCKCGDVSKIDCDIPKEVEDPMEKEMNEKLEKMKKDSECVKHCYCKKCKEDIPELLKEECKSAGTPKKGCSCSKTVCPDKNEMERLADLVKDESTMSEKAKKILKDKEDEEPSDEELRLLNEKLKPQIDAGKAQPITKDKLKATKCSLQCLCDKCGWENPAIEANCKKFVKTKQKNCPACPKDIQCPDENNEISCKMYCFCSKCKKDKRMPTTIKKKCEDFLKSTSETCPCDEVNCDQLGHLGENLKKSASETSSEGKPRQGKIKKKTKMWDEL